jgi:ferredoxin
MTTRRRVHVDPNLCEAHALCIELAPDVFDLGDDIASCTEYPDVADRELVESAVAACPRQAITLIDADPPARSSFEKDQ